MPESRSLITCIYIYRSYGVPDKTLLCRSAEENHISTDQRKKEMKKKLLIVLSALFLAFSFSPTARSAGRVTYSGSAVKILTVFLGYSFETTHPGISSLKACLISDRLGRDYLGKDANQGNNAYCVPFEREANRNTFFRWYDRKFNFEAPRNDLYINDNPQVLVVWTQSGIKKSGVLSLAGDTKVVGAGLLLTLDARAGVNRILYGPAKASTVVLDRRLTLVKTAPEIGYQKPEIRYFFNTFTSPADWALLIRFGADGVAPLVGTAVRRVSYIPVLQFFIPGWPYELDGSAYIDPNHNVYSIIDHVPRGGFCGTIYVSDLFGPFDTRLAGYNQVASSAVYFLRDGLFMYPGSIGTRFCTAR